MALGELVRASHARGAGIAILLLGLAALRTTPSVAAQQAAPLVIVAHLNGIVNPVSAQYVHRVVAAAADQGAALLVLTIDTPADWTAPCARWCRIF